MIDERTLESRFFRAGDFSWHKCIFDLPRSWWSRGHEYAWAANFATADAVVLDAACGLSHPFKFYLSDHCRKVHACDFDMAILSPEAISKAVSADFGQQTAANLPQRYLTGIEYACASVTRLPYPDKHFDSIFCISVLEHLADAFNRHPVLNRMPWLSWMLKRDIYKALAEFHRVLKTGGYVVLTFDYPDINLLYLQNVAKKMNLTFAGRIDIDRPNDAIHFEEKNLYCFRALFRK